MAISRTTSRKAPSQAPVPFFECEQQGGAYGKPTAVPEKSRSGPMREKIYGRAELGKTKK